MNGHHGSAILAGLVGFILGGLLAERVTQLAEVLIALGTVGAFLGGAFGALTGRDVTRIAAIGGGLGVAIGVSVVVADAVVGG